MPDRVCFARHTCLCVFCLMRYTEWRKRNPMPLIGQPMPDPCGYCGATDGFDGWTCRACGGT